MFVQHSGSLMPIKLPKYLMGASPYLPWRGHTHRTAGRSAVWQLSLEGARAPVNSTLYTRRTYTHATTCTVARHPTRAHQTLPPGR